MKKKIVLFLCVMGIMTVLTGCSSGSKEIYTPQNIQEKKAICKCSAWRSCKLI